MCGNKRETPICYYTFCKPIRGFANPYVFPQFRMLLREQVYGSEDASLGSLYHCIYSEAQNWFAEPHTRVSGTICGTTYVDVAYISLWNPTKTQKHRLGDWGHIFHFRGGSGAQSKQLGNHTPPNALFSVFLDPEPHQQENKIKRTRLATTRLGKGSEKQTMNMFSSSLG